MKAWEIWNYQPPGWPEAHPAVIVSSPQRVDNKPDVNVLMHLVTKGQLKNRRGEVTLERRRQIIQTMIRANDWL